MNKNEMDSISLDDVKWGMAQVCAAMMGMGIVPICPCCGEPLVPIKNFFKNHEILDDGLFIPQDIYDNNFRMSVLKHIYQSTSKEHIVSQTYGGSDSYTNLTLVHNGCNSDKSEHPAFRGFCKAYMHDTDDIVYLGRGNGTHIYETITRDNNRIPDYIISPEDIQKYPDVQTMYNFETIKKILGK